MSRSAHREPPAPPQSSTVVAEPATPEAVTQDWDARSNTTDIHPSSYGATPHTHGRKS